MALAVSQCHRLLCDLYVTKLNFIRHGHRVRGKAPAIAKTLQQRLDGLNVKDEVYDARVNIGLPVSRASRSVQTAQRLSHVKNQRKDVNLEKLSRNRELLIDLDKVHNDWLKNNGPHHIKKVAEHYGIYEHLYHEGFFIPRVSLNVLFHVAPRNAALPVYYGNTIKPCEAKDAPEVSFTTDEEDSLWTLMLTNLDGHLTQPGKEYIHWCISNIKGDKIETGETLVNYLQPIPPKGTGFHRYVFVLYKQNKPINYSIDKVESCTNLEDRTFKTRDWYQKYQDDITPAGIAFFQSDWDETLREFYHQSLNIKEPGFEYDFTAPYIKPQEWFPLREPFNLYMDKYRDPKQIAKEYLLLKLKNEHPFKKPAVPLKFPNAHPFPKNMPSWLKLHEKKIRLGWGRINDV